MATNIRLKHSATQDKVPLPTDLLDGEVALNTNVNSPALYMKDNAGNIVKLAGAGAIGGTPATEASAGIAELATQAEVTAGTDDQRIVTPLKLQTKLDAAVVPASETAAGIAELATQDEVTVGTDDATIVTPLKLQTKLSTAGTGATGDFGYWNRTGTVVSPTNAGDDITTTGDVSGAAATFTSNVQMASANSGPLAGFRNQIINPNFTIQQRGTSFSAPADVYTADRWWMGNAAGRNVSFTSDGPYQNAMLITNNTSDNVFLRQGIEIQQGKCGPFTLNSVWTLSLWSDSNAWVGRSLGVAAFRDAGKMNDSIGQVDVTATAFVATGETSSGMSRYALQVTIDASPAATHSMLCLGLSLPSGGHRISAVQFEPGPVATPFEHRPIGAELALCQRYYETIPFIVARFGVQPGQTSQLWWQFSTQKRGTPTVGYVSASGANDGATNVHVNGAGLKCDPSATGSISFNNAYADAEL